MSTNKIIQALGSAAGSAGGAGLNVEDVFSTYLYDGNGSQNLTVTNNIDLAGEGGMVWYRRRDAAENNSIEDTERGLDNVIYTDSSNAEADPGAYGLQAFNSDGFTAGYDTSGGDYVSWTFRKAPKFFDVVTYTGNGTTNRQISHNLGSAPGCIIVKRTNGLKDWAVYHRGKGNTHYGTLNTNEAFYDNATWWQDTDPTSTNFTVGNSAFVNANGDTYVAYLFAHNNGDGEFGPDADQDIIKCGSYTGTGASQEIDLGFEAQWVLIKNTTNSQSWAIIDNMRGFTVEGVNDQILTPNDSTAEGADSRVFPTSSGFGVHTADYRYNGSGSNYIYVAIRRGPMATPESASEVFEIDTQGSTGDGNEPSYRTTFPVDMALQKSTAGSNGVLADRLRGTNRLFPNGTDAELSYTSGYWDYMNGWRNTTSTYAPNHAYMWRRAPGFFDTVAYTGNGSNRSLTHNLGAVPEMIWFKPRSATGDWVVHHKDAGGTYPSSRTYLRLNSLHNTTAYQPLTSAPSETTLALSASSGTNANGTDYIAYLFASISGVSKVGSYTGNGSSQTIDCGFSNGAKFVLIKSLGSDSWMLFDSTRGIVSGNDPFFNLEGTSHFTTYDVIDPHSSGFIVNQETFNQNQNNSGYTFYAIAA